ncbi:MAG: DUF2779 domain-containing protein [Acholeplasmatales bacterium]|nr:DUF2779 domain-containing protein [Acholeplasmatales bacterium]
MKKLISKSKYVSFIECPKRYYLSVHHKELESISENTKKRLESGSYIGDLAMNLFGDYIDVTTIDNNGKLMLDEMIKKTQYEINNNTKNICEASFLYEDLYCAVDILHKTDLGYEIYEVKSTTEVLDYHLIDSAFQKYVLTMLGINITNVYIVTINNEYIKEKDLDINKLFNITNVTNMINDNISNIPNILPLIRNIRESKEIPNIKLSKACDKPYECSFKEYCFKDIAYPSIFDLANNRKKYDFYNDDIISFSDLYNSKYYKKLTQKNKTQIEFELFNKDMYINKENISKFLNKIKYPLYLLDFETMQPVVPLFEGTKPYQQITFQYSLHILYEDNTLIHKEFLAPEGVNPTYDLVLNLLNDIPKDSMIMAYNASFEKSRIKELANMYPNLKDELLNRCNNFIDLMDPFKDHDIYLKEFKGSYSIKYVLPGLFPLDKELDYHNLDIVHNGGEAMRLYEDLINYNNEDRLKIRNALLKYCELDTYAMVKILLKLYELVKE